MGESGANIRLDGFSQLPQPFEHLDDFLDLLAAFFVLPAEEGLMVEEF